MSATTEMEEPQKPHPEKWYTLIMQMSSGEKIITTYEDGSYICTFVSELIGTLLHYPRLMHMAHFARDPEFRQIPELAKLIRITFWPTATGPGVMPGDRFFSINRQAIYPFMDPMPAPVPPIVRLVRALNNLIGVSQIRMAEHPEEPTVLWSYVPVPEYAKEGPAAWLVADEIDEELFDISSLSQVAAQLQREDDEAYIEQEDEEDEDYGKPRRSKKSKKGELLRPSGKRKSGPVIPSSGSSSPGVPYKKRAKFVK